MDPIQAVPKGNLLDGIVRRATELGVAAIPPVTARRSPPQGAFPGRLTRGRRIALEAVKQYGRSVVPEVREPLEAEECLRRPPAGEGWLLHPGGEPLGRCLAPAGGSPPGRLVLGVGPEGDGRTRRRPWRGRRGSG
ncbi:MAG: RNA methyltransferase [Acidobacteria bacterium]|nr:RNA methyltransferase [Acidobacteriota bacterium]